MRTELAASAFTALLVLCIGCGGNAEDGKGSAGKTRFEKAADRARLRIDNLRQIGMAMHDYWDANNYRFPAQALRSKEGIPLLSWRVAILPYIGQKALYEQFTLDEPWNSEHNVKLLERMPDVYKTPDLKTPYTGYVVFTGEGTPFGGQEAPRLSDIMAADGSANTIMVVESREAVFWTKPEDLPFDRADSVQSLGDVTEQYFLALFFDGSQYAIDKEKCDAQTLRRLIQHADGQPVDREQLK